MKKKISVGLYGKRHNRPTLNQPSQHPNQLTSSDNRIASLPRIESQQIIQQNKQAYPTHNSNQTEEALEHLNFREQGAQGRIHQDYFAEVQQERKESISKIRCQKFNKKKLTQLNNIIFTQKVRKLNNNFIKKLKRNNVYAEPTECQVFKEQQFKYSFLNAKGIFVGEKLGCFLNILFVLNIIVTSFVQSLCIVFVELTDNNAIKLLQILGIVVYLLQIILNLITVRVTLGRKLQTLRQISEVYLRQSLYIDIINVTIIILNFATSSSVLIFNILKIFILLKFPDWLGRIKKLQVQLIESYNKEQYWSLIKVFLFNFIYAHILSIVLLSMANINSEENWLQVKGITNSPWFQRYIWSYYWSTTIMLTIGFGDITPKCYQQALVMIFVEVISCIILAYNINCLGTLISNIRASDQEMHKNLKVFKKLAEKNSVSQDLSWKINNFIQENSNIKKLTNIEEQATFVENLPSNYKGQYLKESNRHIFKKIYFFSSLMEKTLCALSQKLKAKIAHPLQVILNKQSNFDLLILKKGEIACKSNKRGFLNFPNLLLNKVKVEETDSPFLLHTNFITKESSPYKILSTVHSLLYYLDYESLTEILRNFSNDFELYCQLRDKSKYYLDEFQVFMCGNCKSRHSEFNCPKYHFIPFKEHVVHKQLLSESKKKNQRAKFYRKKSLHQQRFFILQNNKKQAEDQLNRQSNLLKTQIRQNLSKVLKQRSKTQLTQSKQNKNTLFDKQLSDTLAEAINTQMITLFQQREGLDSVWLIKTDQLQNFKNYFPKSNPSQLEIIFKRQAQIEAIEDEQNDLMSSTQRRKKGDSLNMDTRKKIKRIQSDIRRKKLFRLVSDIDIQKKFWHL